MKKDKNKGKKKLTAVGAVVAAGLTPGIISGAPVSQLPPNAGLTAADVVAIDGNTYGFGELLAMQKPGGLRYYAAAQGIPQVAIRYGVQRPPQVATHYGVQRPPQATTMYGVPRPMPKPQDDKKIQQKKMQLAIDSIQWDLVDYCALLIDADYRGIFISPESDLTRELGMTEDELKELAAEIKDYYGVEVSYKRFYLVGQLNTLRLVAEYIYKLTHVWD